MGFVGYSWVVASDKYVYFPAVGLVILVAWGLDRLWLVALRLPGRGPARAVLAACVLAAATAEGLATHRQLYWWQDTVNLCQRMLVATPNAWSLEVSLGAALTQAGRHGEALPHLRRALELKPRSWIAYNNLGTILANQGRINEAIACYQRALRLKPGYVDAMNNLAWDLSVHEFRKPPANADAVALAEAACRRTGYRRPGFLDTLAAAYANVGRFDEAVRTAERALNLANAAGQKPLARQIQQRLDLYRAQRPLRE
jgi:tetratricopeptide (TPR) repeat protein